MAKPTAYLDACILVALFDSADPRHAAVEAALVKALQTHELVLSNLTLDEFLHSVVSAWRRSSGLPAGVTAAQMQAHHAQLLNAANDIKAAGMRVVPDAGSYSALDDALSYIHGGPLGSRDSFHVAYAEASRADVLLTTDKHFLVVPKMPSVSVRIHHVT